jgi:hypothetical protein
MREAVARRRRERQELVDVARGYVDRLAERLDVRAAAVAGSVARGDFNVWSDIDVVVVIDELPPRLLDRLELLRGDRPPRVEAWAFTPDELAAQRRRRNRLVLDLAEHGVVLRGDDVLRQALGADVSAPGAWPARRR